MSSTTASSSSGLVSSSINEGLEPGTFYQAPRIDMKQLVSVGNMSISPSNRDVVLASRKGLFIIDLEFPLEVPRFLPQGGTWDVADVQWNPHPVNQEYIVSTSSEKLLIWNLNMIGRTNIEHILHSHYRAITDINWSNHEPNTVTSCGIDGWLWSWDLRDVKRPCMGFCAFNSGATQVKWNRRDKHLLASSHGSEVLLWDSRKGSLPITTIRAHDAKIYGIDWSRKTRDELITCSLDKKIKIWQIGATSVESSSPQDRAFPEKYEPTPTTIIRTSYPVWRARHLPFGDGVLSLPQRSGTTLEMFHAKQPPDPIQDDPETPLPPSVPVESFEGHSDIVKEYVWRTRGGQDPLFDDREFQLITWSQDCTLRFWPIDSHTLEKVGHVPGSDITVPVTRRGAKYNTFRTPTPGPTAGPNVIGPILSAPVGHRSILAGVRAGPAGIQKEGVVPVLLSGQASSPSNRLKRAGTGSSGGTNSGKLPKAEPPPVPMHHMTRGGRAGRPVVDPVVWLNSINVEKRDGSADTGSGGKEGDKKEGSGSHTHSKPRPRLSDGTARSEHQVRPGLPRTRSKEEESRDAEATAHNLKDEITSAVNDLKSCKVELEKIDLSKRACTVTLTGPWGAGGTPTFIRAFFSFPEGYPEWNSAHPPNVELDKTPHIEIKTRAKMLRNLRKIRNSRRSFFASCLRFLLGLPVEEGLFLQPPTGRLSDASSDEEERPRRNLMNVPMPRTAQGVFSMNGALVCTFPSGPPRYIRGSKASNSRSPSRTSKGSGGTSKPAPLTRGHFSASSGDLQQAVRGLARLAYENAEQKGDEDPDRLGPSTVFTRTSLRTRNQVVPTSWEAINSPFRLLSKGSTKVCVRDISHLDLLDKELAIEYVIKAKTPIQFCVQNAEIARSHGRYDHERIFRTLQMVLGMGNTDTDTEGDMVYKAVQWGRHPLARDIVNELYDELGRTRNIVMLSMMSVLLLEVDRLCMPGPNQNSILKTEPTMHKVFSQMPTDYFTLRRREAQNRPTPQPAPSSVWQRLPSLSSSPMAVHSPPVASRPSWANILNPRLLISSVSGLAQEPSPIKTQETLRGSISEALPLASGLSILPRSRRASRVTETKKMTEKVSGSPPATPMRTQMEPSPLGGGRRPAGSHRRRGTTGQKPPMQTRVVPPKKVTCTFAATEDEMRSYLPFVTQKLRVQMTGHLLFYAEILFQWGQPSKRIEFLKYIPEKSVLSYIAGLNDLDQEPLVLEPFNGCLKCGTIFEASKRNCRCRQSLQTLKAPCSICRTPVKGLSRTCLLCSHISHTTCWAMWKVKACPTGCGCACPSYPVFQTKAAPPPESPVSSMIVESPILMSPRGPRAGRRPSPEAPRRVRR